jgi:hypothetical protein
MNINNPNNLGVNMIMIKLVYIQMIMNRPLFMMNIAALFMNIYQKGRTLYY